MLSNICKDCKHVAWLVAIGQGVRCTKKENNKLNNEGNIDGIPIIISCIKDETNCFEKR
jgi:hypothetical protein